MTATFTAIPLAMRTAAFARLEAYAIDIHTDGFEVAVVAVVEAARRAKTSVTKLTEAKVHAAVEAVDMLIPRTQLPNPTVATDWDADTALRDLDREQADREAAANVAARTAEEPVKAPRKGAHADCTHPATKVARAACRRARARA